MNELTSTEALSVLRITTEEGESFRPFHVFSLSRCIKSYPAFASGGPDPPEVMYVIVMASTHWHSGISQQTSTSYAVFGTPRHAPPDNLSGPAGQRGHVQNLQDLRCPDCNELKKKDIRDFIILVSLFHMLHIFCNSFDA